MKQEIIQKIKAQEEHCKKKQIPLFAPSDGICFSCGRQIYDKLNLKDCEELITGCPYCCYSFVE